MNMTHANYPKPGAYVRFWLGSAVGVWIIGTICALAHAWASGGF